MYHTVGLEEKYPKAKGQDKLADKSYSELKAIKEKMINDGLIKGK